MTNNSRLLLGLLMATPGMAYALGLGDIKLGSALNQPLVAEIELVGATPEELAQLRAGLASRESFDRYGIDRPQFLSTLQFNVVRDPNGRNVLQVRSSESITEPFLTFLVEVNWPRGRLIREYTVLLDPPVFEQKTTPAPTIAAPRTGVTAAPAAGAVTRTPPPAPAPAPAPAPTPVERPAAPAPRAPSAGGEYTVASGDTLTNIARRQGAVTRDELNRVMIAIYRANPGAFDGNINRLNRGAVLRIPGSSELESLSSRDAAAEVRRQMTEWRGAAAEAAPADEAARLRLVTPSEPVDGQGTGTAQGAAAGAGAAGGTAAAQAAEARRLLELKNAELARLQGTKPEAGAAAAPATTPAPEAAAAAEGAAPTAAPAEGAAPVAEPAPAKEPAAKPPRKPKPAPVEEPGLLESLQGRLPFVALGGVALLLAGLFGFRFLKRRREEETDDAFRVLERSNDDTGSLPALSETSRLQREEAERSKIVVEESDDDSGEYEAPPIVPTTTPRTSLRPEPEIRGDDTLSSETALNLEQADPLAEADFHMAYGLYDQAADIVKLAIGREPDRRDLKLKLLEVYFVWGNRDSFLDVARELGRTRADAAPGEWEKVVIMGRQIAPEDPLFAGESGRAADVDVDLDAGGQPGMDLELLGDETGTDFGKARADADAIDLDLGQALGGDSLEDTGEAQRLEDTGLDLELDDTRDARAIGAQDATVEQPRFDGGTTREMAPRIDSPTVEQPALARGFGGDAPTIETPALAAGQTVRATIDSALDRRGGTGEATQELSIDDLGFDLDKLEASAVEPGGTLAGIELPVDAPTMIAGLDERSRDLLRQSEAGDLAATRELPAAADRDDATQLAPIARLADAAEETGQAHEIPSGDLDLDLDELARALENDTVEQPRRDDLNFSADVFGGSDSTAIRQMRSADRGSALEDLDLDVGATVVDREADATARLSPDDLSLPDLEPVTLSEVGTKLDLARAYMDMGDPDGARSILQEVLGEGSASQKLEAQRLIETLPG
jgi:pilus assembly protein FimV